MKKIYKYLLALLCMSILFPYGCSNNFLDEKVLTFYSEENYYNTADGMDLAVVALYSDVMYYMIFNNRTAFYNAWVLGTDVAEPSVIDYRYEEDITAHYVSGWNAESALVLEVWKDSYAALSKANMILANIGLPEWESDTQKNRIIGNALFFRSWWYFYLVQAYGDIPLVTAPVSEAKTDYVRTPKAEVYAQIVKDLTEAISALPDVGEKEGEIGKGAAQHLLAQVYLTEGEYDKAEQTATALIESGAYHLMSERFGVEKDKPGTAWTDLFWEGNINRWEGNYETIWAVQAADRYQTEGNSHYLKCWWLNQYTKVTGLTYSMDYWQRGKGIGRASEYFLNLFGADDDRGSEYAIKRTWVFNNATVINSLKKAGTPLTQVVNGVTVEVNVGDTVVITSKNLNSLYPMPTKFMDTLGSSLNECYSDKDVPLMRLAETYLLRAEARFRKGNLTGAADDINILRRRAHASEISSAEVTLDFLLDERARELTGEENRRFTLVRTGKLIERNKLYNAGAKDYIAEKHNLYPIPQVEIDRMKDSPDFPQNPGW